MPNTYKAERKALQDFVLSGETPDQLVEGCDYVWQNRDEECKDEEKYPNPRCETCKAFQRADQDDEKWFICESLGEDNDVAGPFCAACKDKVGYGAKALAVFVQLLEERDDHDGAHSDGGFDDFWGEFCERMQDDGADQDPDWHGVAHAIDHEGCCGFELDVEHLWEGIKSHFSHMF